MKNHPVHLSHPKYRPDIDGLRALAVLSVVIFHAFPDALKGGFIGVDIFFVISGFLISTIIFTSLEHNSFSFTEFYSRRIRRIFPALLTVLLACYAFGWFALPADEYKQLGKHIAGGAGFISNFLFWKESGYFDTAAETKPLLHLWSLGIEEQFYIIWPLLLCWAWRRRFNRFTLTLAIAAASFFMNIWGIQTQNDVAGLYYSPQTRFWELLTGSILAYTSLHNPLLKTKYRIESWFASTGWSASGLSNTRSLLGAGMLTLGILTIAKEKAFPGWWALLPTLGAALIISAGAQAWINRTILSNRVLVWFGLISFPLYLWHWPLLSFARILASETPAPSVRAAAVAIAIALAWLTKKFIENPIRLERSANAKTATLLGLMIVLGSIGHYTFQNEGLPSRYGKIELKRQAGRYECPNWKRNTACIFGNPNAEKIVVIYGDSHAQHLTNALNEALGNDYKFYLVADGSCFMGENFVFPHVGNKKNCGATVESLKKLRGQEIFAVIRSQRWHGYGIVQKNDIEKAVDDAIHGFGLNFGKIVIVGSTSDADIDCEVSNYYSMPFRSKKKCKTHEDYKEYNKTFISTTRAMATPSNVHFVYPYEKICPHDSCAVITGNVANYTDTHHMTKDAALLIMPEIAAALAR
jgi:peptidoglycan/LPS O-acetylase OafA/YrhL